MHSVRRYKRIFLRELFGVKDATHNAFLGYLSNISVSGLQVSATNNLKPEIGLQLVLKLPLEICRSGFMTVTVDQVWSYHDNVTGFYDLGFRFCTLSIRDKKTIYELIAHYGVGEVIQFAGRTFQSGSSVSRATYSGVR